MANSKSGKSSMGRSFMLLVLITSVAVFTYIYQSPYQTLKEMRKDLKAGNVEQLDQDIDYPAVREGLKRDFQNIAINEVEDDPSIKNRLLGVLGLAIGAPIADTAIDYIVSPAGLRRIVSGSVPILSARSESATEDFNNDDTTTTERSSIKSTEGRYLDLNRFLVTIHSTTGSATALTLTRRGLLSWQVTHVKLMPSRQ